MRRFMLGLLLCLAGSPAGAFEVGSFVSEHGADHPLVGRIVDGAGREVEPEALARAVRGADDLVLGETHTNPDHHRLQARLLAERAGAGGAAGTRVRDDPEGAPGRARRLSGRRRECCGDRRGGGLGEAGLAGFCDLPADLRGRAFGGACAAGGDLDRDTVRRISREGPAAALGPALVGRFGLDRPLPEAARAELAGLLEASHCGMLPASAIPGMIDVQRARDGALADAMVEAGPAAVLIAGAGHARRDRAVPALLAKARPGARVVSVAFAEVEAGRTDPGAYEPGLFDFTVFTPRFDVSDPCEGMKAK